MKESNHQRGYRRDKQIAKAVEAMGSLNTDQIKLLFFPDVSAQMTYRRLRQLVKKKRLKRDRFSMSEPNYYYIDKKPGQIDHVLAVSWVYTWITLNLRSWERIHSFEREVDYKILRSDGFMAIKNTWENKFKFFFIEMDISESGNRFRKVGKYNSLYSSDAYMGSWWVTMAEKFPSVIIVTTGQTQDIQKYIRIENVNNLDFQVYALSQIREECLLWGQQQLKHSDQAARDS